MSVQENFSGSLVAKPHNSRCANAKNPECKCSCGGLLHGAQIPSHEGSMLSVMLSEEQAKPFQDQIKTDYCFNCHTKDNEATLPKEIRGYPHKAGWKVEGFKPLLWLFKTCEFCRYDWVLWKLGVERE